jgi:hypothetical protein
VRRGAALLDAKAPGWCEPLVCAVRNDGLDLSSCTSCVLGLAYARQAAAANTSGYDYGTDALDLDTSNLRSRGHTSVAHGFERPGNGYSYALLQQLWEEEIHARCE